MQYALAAAAIVGLTAALPQGGPPPSPASPECMSSYPGTFNIQVVNVTTASKSKRQDSSNDSNGANTLKIQLQNGKLTDSENRVGYIASNHQFQFDPKPQPNALISSGWAVCPNNTLVLGADAVFKECLSGDFYNLYDDNAAGQCSPVYIQVINGQGSSSGSSPASQQGDGQVTATPGMVSQITDGQIQATTGASMVMQISDGQIQMPTGAPAQQITDGQVQATGMPVSQIGDGQIQATTAAAVSQIGDGQPQAPQATGMPVSQIGDGQIQATTAAAVSQIGDGQPQAPTGAAVSQIGDGQIQSNGSAPAQPSVQPYTGSASNLASSIALVASIGALAFFL